MNRLRLEPHERGLIVDSFHELAPIRPLAGALFHQRLFELAPELAQHFDTECERHREMFMEVLGLVAQSLLDGVPRDEALSVLGRWHDRRGVQRIHYRAMQDALLWMLRQTLGDSMSAEAHRAWRIYFTHLSDVMTRAAAEERLALTLR